MNTSIRAIGPSLAVLVAVAALPVLTSAAGSGGQDMTVREKVRAVQFVHRKRSTHGEQLAMGDRVLTRQALYDESDHRIGAFFTDCVNVGRRAEVFKATLQCSATYRFSDGQVATAGVVKLGGPPSEIGIAIVGGTGAYSSGRGSVTAGAPVEGYDGVDVIHVADK